MTIEGLAAYRQLCLAVELRDWQLELHVTPDYVPHELKARGIEVRSLDRLVVHDPATGTRMAVRVGARLELAAGELLARLVARPGRAAPEPQRQGGLHLIRALLAAALVAVVLLPAPATADARCHSKAECAQKRACSQKRVVPCIHRAAIRWRVSFPILLRKARCESSLNPWARNGVHSGLFQFRTAPPSTWATTPYRRWSAFSAKYSSLAAGWMHHVGRGGEWACR